ncbi:hypothetical protein [Rhodococcus rhodnii]|uniref:Uncharacterized protein n=1 Tax=Rhodococcus rhodnii LMG 5362 TaxID=1273125 RepID=R7WLL2_9NOCA|nr:hypothetical protein [Rhodococcus rhodnii]EOM76180.1 hypothetical protein Rrhod_2546 [Rhodococcus rhodnii LMG 5362]
MFPDYGHDWPLWENSTPTGDAGYATEPDIYGLSAPLTVDMASWHNFWERHFHHERGWDCDESREKWRVDGDDILARLRVEVADFADVKYEPWPLGG